MVRLSRYERSLVLLATAALGAVAGCNGSSRSGGNGSASTAATSSNTNTNPTPSASPSPAPAQSPAPQVAPPVSASLTFNAYAAFREQASFADVQTSPLFKTKIFALEDKGSVRVLDDSGVAVALDRVIPLDPSGGFVSGAGASSLTISDASTALVAVNGTESVLILDPGKAMTAADVTKVDLSMMQVAWPAGTTDSSGAPVVSPMPVSFTASAIVSQKKLYVATSNLNLTTFAYNPGTVIAYDYDPVTRATTNPAIVQTSSFDPTRLTRWAANGAEALLCVNSGIAGVSTQSSSIDVIDPSRAAIVANIPLPAVGATGTVVISADGKRGFVGSSTTAEVFEVDLTALDQELANATVKSEPARFVGKIALPAAKTLNFISSLALSTSGTYLYAVNFNKSELVVVDLSFGPGKSQVVGTLDGFQRSGDPTKFQGNADFVCVRPGVPGVDFTGPAAFVGTISLVAADQTVLNVNVALDGVTFDRN